MERTATFDQTGQYRYRLTRRWQSQGDAITFILLNPSRADHQQDDPTLRRCIGFAQVWGFGGLTVVNLFAYCTPYPQKLQAAADPIGPDNDAHLLQVCAQDNPIVLAWGNRGMGRDLDVLALLNPLHPQLYHLGLTQKGHPRHPLYLPRGASLHPWSKFHKT